MARANTAAWLMSKQERPLVIAEAPIPAPKPRGVLIRVHAIALNPVDAAIQNAGLLWEEYPLIIGSDLAGKIVEVGSEAEAAGFRVGDRVLAGVEKGAFQEYCSADIGLVAKIPEHVSYAQGCVLPMGISTAAVTLFHAENMALDLPQVEPKANGQVVVVWGGSSSVGSCGIQMLCAAGYQVIGVAGASNFQYCKELGASHVFDHKSDNVEQDLIAALEASGKKFAGVFSAIMGLEVLRACVRIADKLGHVNKSRIVGTVVPPDMPMFPLPNPPAGVRYAYCRGPTDFLPDSAIRDIFGWDTKPMAGLKEAVFAKWLPLALRSGQLKCKPEPFIVGRGLDSLQDACDLMAKGVSAQKLVVELE
ncbi:putative GroES-like superfamily, alcohol dehydrogenase-like, NAD(P)-binding domain superfamily [Septoria linicola]|nr:putative GroES-like superfamily, alcohol dehydrogenase-like, NAD(P)-binding domain superfamily [Septoria linicola]